MADIFSWFASAEIAVHETAIADALADLFPEEAAQVSRAVPARVQEFAAGRFCARQAMTQLGYAPAPIPAAPDRSPIWPAGLVGSVTHSVGHCAAAVARAADGFQAIGLDLEPASALPPDILDMVCLPEEQAWLQSQPSADRDVLARAIFSAKECAYKAQYPLSGVMLEFHELRLALDLGSGHFNASFLRACPPFALDAEISGEIRIAEGFIACAATLRGKKGI
jgi:4'-phosphopantetheinyl transferase EntD